MSNKAFLPFAALLVSGLLLLPGAGVRQAHASSATDTTAPFNQSLNLQFSIVYPPFLRFRVGNAAGGSINLMTFTVPATGVGNAVSVAPTGGDAGGGAGVNVEVTGNHGAITITETNNSGGLGLGTGVVADGWINYNQINTASNAVELPPPALSNAGGSTSLPALNSALVTQRTAIWTYSYANASIPNAGTFGTSVNGGRVTYTAVMP
jgi:hypothetical protein